MSDHKSRVAGVTFPFVCRPQDTQHYIIHQLFDALKQRHTQALTLVKGLVGGGSSGGEVMVAAETSGRLCTCSPEKGGGRAGGRKVPVGLTS